MQAETIPSPSSDGRRSRRPLRWRHLSVLLVAVGIVYGQTAGFDFVTYDDYDLIYHNEEFLSKPGNMAAAFATDVFTTHRPESVYYRPILLVSFIVDYQLWRLQPAAYHIVNVLLHLLTAALLYLLLESLLGQAFPALVAALFFALHPVQTESVGWIAGRNDVLMGLFVASMMFFHIRGGTSSSRVPLAGTFSVVSFALALFTKEAAAFYLLLPPLYDLCRGDTTIRKMFRGKRGVRLVTMIVVLAGYFIVRLAVFGAFIGAEKHYATTPLADRILRSPAMVAEYLAMILWPFRLSVVHPPDELFWFGAPWVVLAVLAPIAVAMLLRRFWRRDAVVTLGLLWFAVGMIPLLNILPLAVPGPRASALRPSRRCGNCPQPARARACRITAEGGGDQRSVDRIACRARSALVRKAPGLEEQRDPLEGRY